LSVSAAFYRPWIFESARANFRLIEENRKYVDGEVAAEKQAADPEFFSNYLKYLVKKHGAVSAGIARLQDYHLYSYRGRSHNYGEAVENQHQYALAFTVEMDHDFVRNAPYAFAVLESSRQYLRSGMIALQVAGIIRDMGYTARAHIDGEYEVVCPLVARDAGLGEIGRMGLLMTPELGPRVRIAVVTTSFPLVPDARKEDFSTIDSCIQCKKCAEVCPANAIPFDDRSEINGVLRWQIDQQACFTYWTRTGTDCARCMSVCPFSHPVNALHNIVRYGIKKSMLFRKLALWMDDFMYGRKPRPLIINSSE
jgi:reductive dehalogenase